MAEIVFLNRVRGSFLVLGAPEQYQGKGKFRWSCTGLVPKSDKAQIAKVEAALKAVADAQWGAKAPQMLNAILGSKKECAWLDGDKSTNDGYAGCMSLVAHRYEDKGRPLVFDSDKSPVYQATNVLYPGKAGRLYSGCFINMEVELWAQDNEHGKALRCTLRGVQRAGDGDAFGGGAPPNPDAFGEVAEGADADDMS